MKTGRCLVSLAFALVACGNGVGTEVAVGTARDVDASPPQQGVSTSAPQAETGPCSPGATRECADAPKVGACKPGVSTCGANKTWGACTGAVHPTAEICDGIDNNCDGRIDENCQAHDDAGTHGTVLEGDSTGNKGSTFDGDAGEGGSSHSVTGDDDGGSHSVTGDDDASVHTTTDDCSIAAPRLIFPLSTSRATSQTPALRWELASGSDGARIELCHDRACSNVIQTVDLAGSEGLVRDVLPAGAVYWRAYGMKGTSVGCTPSPAWEMFINVRTAPVNTAWGTVLDVNEDGYADLLVGGGQSWPSQPPTAAYLYMGSSAGLPTTPAATLPLQGIMPPVSSAGDVNGDGFADVIIPPNVYLGSAAGLVTTAAWTIPGEAAGDVASAGDTNGDGYADIVVGHATGTTGAVDIFLGGPSGLSSTPSPSLPFASQGWTWTLANAGDVNGDRFGDITQSPGSLGMLDSYIYVGSAAGLLTTATSTLPTPSAGEFGEEPTGVGDVNGDGYADVAVSGMVNSGFGYRVYIFLGSASGVSSTPATELSIADEVDKTEFGLAKTGLDVNGDGYWDVAVSAPGLDTVYVYMGGPAGVSTTPAAVFTNGDEKGMFGYSMSGADTNGDGFEDLAVSATGAPFNTGGRGTVYLQPGSASGIVTTPSSVIRAPNDLQTSGFGLYVSVSASGS